MTIHTVLEGRNGKQTVIGFDRPLVMIGERLNPTNRKVLSQQLQNGDMSMVRRDARAQVEAGAAVLDVNVGVPLADEPALMRPVIEAVMTEVEVPLCIDSPNVAAVEVGLKAFREMGGKKALINSTTAETDRLDKYLPLAAEYGAALIGLAHDEHGITYNITDRLEAAVKIIDRAAAYGIPQEDILIDCLTLTVGANSQAGWITLEVQRRMWTELGINTTAGASNISFGLPDRPTLNTAYLPLMMSRGLTSAITNPLEGHIQNIILASDLLLGRDSNARSWIKAYKRRNV